MTIKMKYDMIWLLKWNMIWCDVTIEMKYDMIWLLKWNMIWYDYWNEIWYDMNIKMKYDMIWLLKWNIISLWWMNEGKSCVSKFCYDKIWKNNKIAGSHNKICKKE